MTAAVPQVVSKHDARCMAAMARADLALHGHAHTKPRTLKSLLLLTPDGRLRLLAGDSLVFHVAMPMPHSSQSDLHAVLSGEDLKGERSGIADES